MNQWRDSIARLADPGEIDWERITLDNLAGDWNEPPEDHLRRGDPADSINNPIGIALTERQARNRTIFESAQVFTEVC